MLFTNAAFWIVLFMILPFYYKSSFRKNRYLLLLGFSLFWYIWYVREYSLYLFVTIVTSWYAGLLLEKGSERAAIAAGILGTGTNLLILIILKYSDFLLRGNFGLVVPLGISFYTFQAIGYCVDVQRGVCRAERNFGKHALFLAFIPQLVSGPISRKNELWESLFGEREFSYEKTKINIYRIGWGLFKKIAVADNIGLFVAGAYARVDSMAGMWLLANMVLYTLQLYCDFSGCIDIVIGTAGLFGVKLPENFDRPFSARTISEYWRRWHITLGLWMKDYVFYPLLRTKTTRRINKSVAKIAGKKWGQKISTWCCLFVLWSTVGLWHGADWKYWIGSGVLHWSVIVSGELLEPAVSKLRKKYKINTESRKYICFQQLRTFLIVCVGNLFFGSEDVRAAKAVLYRIAAGFTKNMSSIQFVSGMYGKERLQLVIGFAGLLLVIVTAAIRADYNSLLQKKPAVIRWAFYFTALGVIFGSFLMQSGGYGDSVSFIYMQF